jgi:hypothetical protein
MHTQKKRKKKERKKSPTPHQRKYGHKTARSRREPPPKEKDTLGEGSGAARLEALLMTRGVQHSTKKKNLGSRRRRLRRC